MVTSCCLWWTVCDCEMRFASPTHKKWPLLANESSVTQTVRASDLEHGGSWVWIPSGAQIFSVSSYGWFSLHLPLFPLEWTTEVYYEKKYLAKFISYSGSVRWGELSWDRDYENSFMGNIMVPLQSKEWACLLLLVIIIIYIMLWVYPWLESSSVKTRNF